jgi:hypothetical protein
MARVSMTVYCQHDSLLKDPTTHELIFVENLFSVSVTLFYVIEAIQKMGNNQTVFTEEEVENYLVRYMI